MKKYLRMIVVLAAFGVLAACGGNYSAFIAVMDPAVADLERGGNEATGSTAPSGGAASDGEGGPGGQPR